jgi:hypothetical protein
MTASRAEVDAAVLASAGKLREGIEKIGERAEICRLALQAIAKCDLTGMDFGDYVQGVCETALAGEWPECWFCGTAVHDGPCVGEGGPE